MMELSSLSQYLGCMSPAVLDLVPMRILHSELIGTDRSSGCSSSFGLNPCGAVLVRKVNLSLLVYRRVVSLAT